MAVEPDLADLPERPGVPGMPGGPGIPGLPDAPGVPGSGRRPRGGVAAAVCAVLGVGLIGGAVAGTWLLGRAEAVPPVDAAYRKAGVLWRSAAVDTLFPPVLVGDGAGPGGADRRWTRIAVDPDTGCETWTRVLAPAGCDRELRATYTDATRSSVIGVGLVFTPADAATMGALRNRLGSRPPLPPAYGLADRQRAGWTVSVLTDAPVVVYAVSGFADGRPVPTPAPAAAAMSPDDTGAVAQAGLGHEAKAVADRLERALRRDAARLAGTGGAR
ncbi:hypothetical protein ACIQUQ_18700 [Streptomyces sp. NPDC101118]|uniref:hypothetical protein n=1 Tax=Streptomyces sp. NPDC101118 TaxID=3366109 RepID=UPI00381AF344